MKCSYLVPPPTSALDLLRHEKAHKIITFSKGIDDILGGGVSLGQITEFCGVPGIGKTQLGMQLACDSKIPTSLHGLGGGAIYIDTEGSVLAERMEKIAEALVSHITRMENRRGVRTTPPFTVESVLSSIHYYRVHDYTEQLSCIKSLHTFLSSHSDIRLIVIDSVAFHFRRGFDDMALRSRMLTGLSARSCDSS
jgi:RAD51-like protein 2